ncbi:MAG: NAD(P)/FAD-dependent oxidoreductase [Nocardioidaceae bacterium]
MTAREDPLAGATPLSVWLDDPARPAPRPPLKGSKGCDLAVVGGGFSGLWTALLAKEADPEREVVLLEAGSLGWAATGRNGGFCSASITHGAANGRDRFPDEADTLERLGRDNLTGLLTAIDRYRIDCDLERSGEIDVATEPHQVDWLREEAERNGGEFLDTEAVRKEVTSPTYLAGLWDKDGTVMVNPAKLAWGLAQAGESLGVRVYEGSLVTALDARRDRLTLHTRGGSVEARQVALGTNVFPSLLRRVRPRVVPVYDYALATEPLTAEQLDTIGWRNRQGIGDVGNQFHYYRLTPDNRILFGGYDAIYHFGKAIKPSLDQRRETFELLSRHFFETFPQLAGLRFSHAWGGAIDLCGRFCAFFGTAHDGQVAYAAGYTGLCVGATRFGAQVMLDLLSGQETERTRTALVKTKPLPFPPEPFAYLGIQLTRASLAAADRRAGRRNLWLRALDRLGLGYDS